MGDGILRAEADEAAVDVEALNNPAAAGEDVAVDAEHVDVVGVAVQDAGEELELEVQLLALVELGFGGRPWALRGLAHPTHVRFPRCMICQ